MRETRLKINLGSMPHLAAGLELELQAKNVEFKQLPVKATKEKKIIQQFPHVLGWTRTRDTLHPRQTRCHRAIVPDSVYGQPSK